MTAVTQNTSENTWLIGLGDLKKLSMPNGWRNNMLNNNVVSPPTHPQQRYLHNSSNTSKKRKKTFVVRFPLVMMLLKIATSFYGEVNVYFRESVPQPKGRGGLRVPVRISCQSVGKRDPNPRPHHHTKSISHRIKNLLLFAELRMDL